MSDRQSDRFLSRREALALALAAAAGTIVRPLDAAAADDASRLIVRNARPLDAESPIAALRTFETPNDLAFVRNHHAVPDVAANWTLAIDGEVLKPLTLTLRDLRGMGAVRRAATIECAGNGRGRFELPATSGVQWGLGAVSNATWTGVPLAALLERAEVRQSALHLWMEGLDRSPNDATPKFLRSIPRETALADALIAYEMNGKPLPLMHGGPLRLVVPGWYGMAWTKWLTHVHARTQESDNHFMARGYRWPDGSSVTVMRVKSLITAPLDGDHVTGKTARVSGVAWTGKGTIARVEVSSDDGKTWEQARFTTDARPGAWRLWEVDAPMRSAGEQRIRVRATDSEGQTQPEKAAPNPAGYGNNSIHEVRVHAR